jgi:uncharacterized membrane protein YsdA (DUF1294 family)
MNTEKVFQSLGSVLGTIGEYLGKFGIWLWDGVQSFFTWAAVSLSAWFSSLTMPILPTIIKVFSNKTLNITVFSIVALYIVIINICAFIEFGIDKKKSKTDTRNRIPEKKLIKLCVIGGAAGGLIGMQIFRHKTLHKKFTVLVPILFVAELILDSFILGFLGFWAFF